MKGDRDNKSHYGNDNTGERKATSTGGAVTGSHAHLLLIDDPINPKQAASDVLRKTANDWIDKTLSTRKVDAKITPTILIMQRLAEDDPTGVKIQQFTDNPNLKIKHICLPASDEFPVIPSELKGNYINGLLNPLRKDREVLSEFLAKLGTREFAAQMGQQPSPIEGNLVKESWFRYYEKAELLKEINLGRTKVDFFIDGAYSEKSIKGNDPSAIIAFCKFEKNLYILNCIEFWKDFPDLIKYVPTYCKQQQASQKSIVIVEPKANGKSIVQTLKKAKGIDLNVIEGVSPSDSKVVRLTAKTAFIEAERVFLPRGETWVESFIVQCLAFPNSKHDDKIDCLIGAIEKVQTKGKTKYATV
jgi:predicted phage terminase large subunit-like protein